MSQARNLSQGLVDRRDRGINRFRADTGHLAPSYKANPVDLDLSELVEFLHLA